MTDDHRRCDIFADAEQAIGQGKLEAAQAALTISARQRWHFASEEKPFPTFEAKTG
jgi:hypothetical protein